NSDPPAITTVAPMSPPALDRLVRACLAKEPDERISTAHDLKLQLQWVRDAGSQAGVPAPIAERRRSRERLAWIAAGTAARAPALVAALVLPGMMRRPAPSPVMRFSVTASADVTLSNDPAQSAISPDGRLLVFFAADSSGAGRLWTRPLESLAAQPLQG